MKLECVFSINKLPSLSLSFLFYFGLLCTSNCGISRAYLQGACGGHFFKLPVWQKKNSQHTALIELEAMEFTELKFCKNIGLCFTALVTSCEWLLFYDQIKRFRLANPVQSIFMGGIWYILLLLSIDNLTWLQIMPTTANLLGVVQGLVLIRMQIKPG